METKGRFHRDIWLGNYHCLQHMPHDKLKLNILSKSRYNVDLILLMYYISAGQTSLLNSNTKRHGKITEITQNNKLKSNTFLRGY